MRDLNDFQVPNDYEIPLCEINGKVHCMNAEFANINAFTDAVESYPKIHIGRDQLHAITSGDEGKALFLPVNVSFLKRLTQVYYEQGLVESLHLAKSYNQFVVSKSATLLLTILKYIRRVKLLLNPNIRCSGPTLISQLGQTRDWANSTIRCIAWHPYCTKLAVATCDDSVRIFSSETTYCPVLRCKQQKNITCVAWRPLSNTEIAVAYECGILIWNIDTNSLVSRPSMSNAIILQRLDHRPIMSIAWSPMGDKLVSAAACDAKILVWDPELDSTVSLKRPVGFGHVLVKWSPSGEKLVSCSDGVVFRVWDSRNWECERWTVVSGRVQSACWSKYTCCLLFATTTEPIIYGVIVQNELVFANETPSSSKQALPMFDVSKCDLDGVIVGGLIQCMETDTKGKYLAVLFKDTNCVAIFNVVKQPGLQLIASSLVMGSGVEKPTAISFQQNFEAGACLSIGWSSGRIQYYPIIYSDLNNKSNFNQSVNTSVYTSFNTSHF